MALLNQGADMEASDFYGWTPLMKAAYRDNFEIVKLLVENGANVNAKNYAGHSVLYVAEKLNRNPEIGMLLVNSGAEK
jgi:ankyrin repeat protein